MTESGVYITDSFYSFTDLKEKGPFQVPELDFCHNWQNGLSHVEVQTSGSSGAPKNITLSREVLKASAFATLQAIEPLEKHSILMCLNMKAIGGLMMLVRAMEWDCNVSVVPASSDPMESVEDEHVYTLISLVPYQLYHILENPESVEKLKRFHTVILGGAPVRQSIIKEIRGFKTTFFNSYGMTETCSHIALKKLNGHHRDKYFKVLPGVEIKCNEAGCLEVKGSMTNGEWLTTNDLATLFSNDEFEITGRADQFINSGGIKINPVIIENLANEFLQSIHKPLDLFAIGLPDPKLGERQVLFIESETNESIKENLLYVMGQTLERYKAPKEIIFVPRFELTQTGKIDKRKTAERYLNGKE